MKVYLLSDNVDTRTGMRLAGISGTVIHTREEVDAELKKILKDNEIGILLVTQKLYAIAKDRFDSMRVKNPLPLIVEIPDRHGNSSKSEAVMEFVKNAVGIKI